MLGMNDVGSWLYEKSAKSLDTLQTSQTPQSLETSAAEQTKHLAAQTAIRETYLRNMAMLAQKLTEIHSKIIFITPSIYDETAQLDVTPLIGKNAELANFGKHVAKLALNYQATMADFQTPMLAVNKKLQANNPKATVVSHDRVHPGVQGHFVMAYSFLKSQQESQYVSNFSIDANNQKLEIFSQCDLVKPMKITSSSVDFTCQAKTLPFPVEGEQLEAAGWVPFQQELNQQFYRVTGLEKGSYKLLIDNIEVGQYADDKLAEGINLAINTKTPMYQQALQVKALNDKRAQESDKIRTVAHVHYKMLAGFPNVDQSNVAEVTVALKQHVENAKGKSWYGYLKKQAEKYVEVIHTVDQSREKIETLFDQIYQINQPKVHHWQLVKNVN